MIDIIDTFNQKSVPLPQGSIRHILTASRDNTRVEVARYEVDSGQTLRIPSGDRTQVFYLEQGDDAEITLNAGGRTTAYVAHRGCGVYLEPGEEGVIKASGARLVLLSVTVPKHAGKARDSKDEPPTGYFFDESKLQALVDERRIRTRTFWVNKETGLSSSWDMQLGRMHYGPNGHSPRHVHHASKSSSVKPEHFYLIETGIGEVKHDDGTLAVGPGSMVFIPEGEWHQLIASDSGLNYIEFQAPFDFVTTMDQDPLGKNWYVEGTDDGSGNPRLWVQS